MGNKIRIKKIILEKSLIFEVKDLYKLLMKEKLDDNELATLILELMADNLNNDNIFLTLINLLKNVMDNNNLTRETCDNIYEQVNRLLKKDCKKEIYLLLDNLKSYINCLFDRNSNEKQLRCFYEQELAKNKRTIDNLKKVVSKRETKIKELEKANKSKDKKYFEKKKILLEKEKQLTKLKAKTYDNCNDSILSLAEVEKIKKYLLVNLEEPKTKEELMLKVILLIFLVIIK